MTVLEALESVLQRTRLLPSEEVPLTEGLGRVLAEPVSADRDQPPWDNSAMDGYAVRCEDTQRTPATLEVLEMIPCGSMPSKRVGPGQCSQIMTGAIIPEGADSVVRIEDTEEQGSEYIRVTQAVPRGMHVRSRGEDYMAGSRVLEEGTVIGPADLAMMASVGRVLVQVYQRPRVAILATGDELVDLGETPGRTQIMNSNSYALSAQVACSGGIYSRLGIARDDPKDLQAKIESGHLADVLLISGGISVGRHDFVREVLSGMGIALSFWRVSMKPGHPLAFAEQHGKLFFALPGNPVSTQVTFEEFVRPALLKMAGHQAIFRPMVKAVSLDGFQKDSDGKIHFVRVVLSHENGRWEAQSTGHQGSGRLSSLVKANGLMVIPAEIEHIRAGEPVHVQLLDKGFPDQIHPGF